MNHLYHRNKGIKKRILILLTAGCIILFLSYRATAQNTNNAPYSFSEQNKNLSYPDTTQIEELIKKVQQRAANLTGTPQLSDSSITMLKKAKQLSMTIGYSKGILKSLMILSAHYLEKNDTKQAIALLWEALPYCQSKSVIDNAKQHAIWDMAMARIYAWKIDIDSTIIYLKRAENLAIQINNKILLLRIYFNMGSAWIDDDNNDNAVYYLKKAEDLAIECKDRDKLCYIYNNLAVAYNTEKNSKVARSYALQAIAISRQQHLIQQEEIALTCLANSFFNMGALDSAITYYQKSLKLNTGNISFLRLNYWGLWRAYALKKQPKLALQYAQKGLEVQPNVINYSKVMAGFYQELSQLYADLGNFKSAYHYQLKRGKLSDSIYDLERTKTIDKLERQSRMAEKDKEIAQKKLLLSEKDNLIQTKNLWIGALSTGALLLILSAAGFYRIHQHKQRGQIEKMKRMQQEHEISELKAIIKGEERERGRVARELHDGMGSILAATIMNCTVLGKQHELQSDTYKEVMHLLDEMGHEIRKTANNLMPEILMHYSLPEAIKVFCSHIQRADELVIDLQAIGEFDVLDNNFTLSIYRIVQELIHNVVKHSEASMVLVQLMLHNENLTITVEDNGTGYEAAQEHKGMGLRNLQSRVHSMNGQLHIESTKGNGTSIFIEFDLQNQNIHLS